MKKVVGTALALALAATTSHAETVDIGVVLTYSGGAAQFGEQIDRGMNLYLKQHPEAFGGHEVNLIKRDSKRPGGDIAKNAVRELITREKVKMLAGFVFSPNAMASAPLATDTSPPISSAPCRISTQTRRPRMGRLHQARHQGSGAKSRRLRAVPS